MSRRDIAASAIAHIAKGVPWDQVASSMPVPGCRKDRASDTFAPDGKGATCGAACHKPASAVGLLRKDIVVGVITLLRFRRLLGQFVGVKGTITTDDSLNLKMIDNPSVVEPVDQTKVNSSVAAQILPPSLLPHTAQASTNGE